MTTWAALVAFAVAGIGIMLWKKSAVRHNRFLRNLMIDRLYDQRARANASVTHQQAASELEPFPIAMGRPKRPPARDRRGFTTTADTPSVDSPQSGAIWFTAVKYEEDDIFKDRPVLLLERHPSNDAWWRCLMFTSQDQSSRDGYVKSAALIAGEQKSWLKTDRVLNIERSELRRFAGESDSATWHAAQTAWKTYLLELPEHSWMNPSGGGESPLTNVTQRVIDAILPSTITLVQQTEATATRELLTADPDLIVRTLARRFTDPLGTRDQFVTLRLQASQRENEAGVDAVYSHVATQASEYLADKLEDTRSHFAEQWNSPHEAAQEDDRLAYEQAYPPSGGLPTDTLEVALNHLRKHIDRNHPDWVSSLSDRRGVQHVHRILQEDLPSGRAEFARRLKEMISAPEASRPQILHAIASDSTPLPSSSGMTEVSLRTVEELWYRRERLRLSQDLTQAYELREVVEKSRAAIDKESEVEAREHLLLDFRRLSSVADRLIEDLGKQLDAMTPESLMPDGTEDGLDK